ncbi:MAG: hypothetical protein IJ574_02830 [Bacilli bacterium]|nr:hypothetical protein [Bacilli bacterium]
MKNDKRKVLEMVIKDDYYVNDVLIYKFINNGLFDEILRNLKDIKVLCPTTENKKGYLNKYEQFLNIVHHFIRFFDNDFYFLGKYRAFILAIIFEQTDNNAFLLSDKYYADNNDYYINSFKKYIVTGLSNSINDLLNSEIIHEYFQKENILNKEINNLEYINKLYNVILRLSLVNAKEFKTIYLFDNKEDTNSSYLDNKIKAIELIINNYYKNIIFINYCLDHNIF